MAWWSRRRKRPKKAEKKAEESEESEEGAYVPPPPTILDEIDVRIAMEDADPFEGTLLELGNDGLSIRVEPDRELAMGERGFAQLRVPRLTRALKLPVIANYRREEGFYRVYGFLWDPALFRQSIKPALRTIFFKKGASRDRHDPVTPTIVLGEELVIPADSVVDMDEPLDVVIFRQDTGQRREAKLVALSTTAAGILVTKHIEHGFSTVAEVGVEISLPRVKGSLDTTGQLTYRTLGADGIRWNLELAEPVPEFEMRREIVNAYYERLAEAATEKKRR